MNHPGNILASSKYLSTSKARGENEPPFCLCRRRRGWSKVMANLDKREDVTLHSEVISAMAHKRIRQNVNFAHCGKKEILYHWNQYQLTRLAKKSNSNSAVCGHLQGCYHVCMLSGFMLHIQYAVKKMKPVADLPPVVSGGGRQK